MLNRDYTPIHNPSTDYGTSPTCKQAWYIALYRIVPSVRGPSKADRTLWAVRVQSEKREQTDLDSLSPLLYDEPTDNLNMTLHTGEVKSRDLRNHFLLRKSEDGAERKKWLEARNTKRSCEELLFFREFFILMHSKWRQDLFQHYGTGRGVWASLFHCSVRVFHFQSFP